MRAVLAAVGKFFHAPPLPLEARHTYRHQLAYALLDAVAGGIVANAPVVALKEMGAPVWQLGLSLTLSGIGMLSTLYLSSWMAPRPKIPFVFVPGMACAAATTAMALTSSSFVFLLLSGLGLMFSTISRPAITAIVRLNYPATHRGSATGEIRKWSSLAYLLAFLVSAVVLDLAGDGAMTMVRVLIVLAGAMSLLSYFCFRRIRVNEDPARLASDFRPRVMESLRPALRVVWDDGRYRRYLLGCFMYGFSGLAYVSYIPKFLERDLHYNYVQCALLLQVIPSVASFLMTGFLGRWFDRANVWTTWAWIRFGWGADPLLLAATPVCATAFPPAAIILPVLARASRGVVQGGSWILWWQIGVGHFAKPGEDTSRYQGILAFLNGLMSMTAPAAGACILWATDSSLPTLFLFGGVGVVLSGFYSLLQAAREKGDNHLTTIADFEAKFERLGD